MSAPTRPEGFSAYIVVTAAYWGFMLSDGALRMLVLLHFHTVGFSPFTLAWLFLMYEFMGMITNLSAGWLAARFGLTSTLYAGLILQVLALIALSQLSTSWTMVGAVIYVMGIQGVSGVAKDLAKMSSKSAVKLLAPENAGGLFKWVALLTGSKNAVKGFGFLLGAALLGAFGFSAALIVLSVALGAILIAVFTFMPRGLPSGSKGVKFSQVISKDRRINQLSLARLFLFGARDVWFVVAIPVYFHAALLQHTQVSAQTAFFIVGSFMAVWVICYGAIQATAPRILKAKNLCEADIIKSACRWAFALTGLIATLTVASLFESNWLPLTMVTGLLIFGAILALNSALHSYLILAFSDKIRVTLDVGFYYSANSAGRLLGTLLSGLSYQMGGLTVCLATACVMAGASWGSMRYLTKIPLRA